MCYFFFLGAVVVFLRGCLELFWGGCRVFCFFWAVLGFLDMFYFFSFSGVVVGFFLWFSFLLLRLF